MTEINIGAISQDTVKFGNKVTLIDGRKKYSFFDTKKDGSHTKAFEQYTKFQFKVGNVVSAEVAEEEKTFVNDKGKSITYTQRTIMYFEEIEHTPTVSDSKPPVVSQDTKDLMEYAKALESRISTLEGKLIEKDIAKDEKVENLPF